MMIVLYMLIGILLISTVWVLWVLTLYFYMHSIKKKKLLYAIDESKKVTVTKDIIYKTADSKNLLMDIYRAENLNENEKLPVVIFVHGEGPEVFIKDAKEWGVYSSYGKLLASKGFVAVTFNHRYAAGNFEKIKDVSTDVTDAADYIKNNAVQLSIDPEKICVWAFSLGGIYASLFLKDKERQIKCLVSYYGLLDLYTRVNERDSVYEAFTPYQYLLNAKSNNTSILIVKAANDKIKGVNQSIDYFIKAAKRYNIKYDYIVHNTGGHSFDLLNDNNETREVIEKTLRYIEQNCK
jgi:dipeptidyl aminopeptidase/acylaminoacyl peptidase